MKYSLVALLWCIALSKTIGQTTLEEYNYLTKGYKIQLESGLDMKKGYKLVDLHENTGKRYGSITIIKSKGLYRQNENMPCAILVTYGSTYICVPHYKSSQEIWLMYGSRVSELDRLDMQLVLWSVSHAAAFFAQNN
jgi:hypothetical protein